MRQAQQYSTHFCIDQEKKQIGMAGNITAETVLKKPIGGGSDGFEDVTMGSIWADSPVLVLVMRRPGCSEYRWMDGLTCRDEAESVCAAGVPLSHNPGRRPPGLRRCTL